MKINGVNKPDDIHDVSVGMFLSLLCAPLENIIVVDGSISNTIYDDTDVIKHDDYDFFKEVPEDILNKNITQIITDRDANFIINVGDQWDLLHY